MRAGAVLVNVGRGGIVDGPALIAALRQGARTWSPPSRCPGSLLWELPTVLLSPHTVAL